jgi:pyruvate dehydrogenase (quinone)
LVKTALILFAYDLLSRKTLLSTKCAEFPNSRNRQGGYNSQVALAGMQTFIRHTKLRKASMKTTADLMAELLTDAGVKRIYGVVGDSLNGFTDALRRRKTIQWVHVRHEEGAAFAAGAEAHLTGQLAVCAGSCGPGNLHLINGLFDCHRSGVPVLAIAAHIPSTEIGIDYFQSTHPEVLFKECSHYVELVSQPEQLDQVLARAIRVAVARRGVAVVVMPGDVALKPAVARHRHWLVPRRPVVIPPDEDIQQLAGLLNEANRITLFCGAGCAGAHEEVLMLAKKLQSPIVHTLRGKEFIEHDNPYDVGMTGLVGFASGYKAMKSCDALLILGADFPYRQFFPEVAIIAQIDLRPEALGNRCPLDIGLLGDVRATIAALLPDLEEKDDSSHLDDAVADYHKSRKDLDALAESRPHSTRIHPQYVTKLVSQLAAPDAIFTCDVGTPIAWTARYLQLNGTRRLVGSFNHGSMANAMLHAIGAQSAFPDRQVISFSGDGGFTMMMGEFVTLIQMGLPIKIIVLNNGTLGFVELEMKASGFVDSECELKNPDFAAMANAMGILGVRIDRPQQIEEGIQRALKHDGPALVDIVSARQELVMPPTTTFDEAKHFGIFTLKAVLDGRFGELIDLASSNLTR